MPIIASWYCGKVYYQIQRSKLSPLELKMVVNQTFKKYLHLILLICLSIVIIPLILLIWSCFHWWVKGCKIKAYLRYLSPLSRKLKNLYHETHFVTQALVFCGLIWNNAPIKLLFTVGKGTEDLFSSGFPLSETHCWVWLYIKYMIYQVRKITYRFNDIRIEWCG